MTWIDTIRERIRRNLDRLAISDERKAAILEAEVARVVLATEAGEPLNDSLPTEPEAVDTQETGMPDIPAPVRARLPWRVTDV